MTKLLDRLATFSLYQGARLPMRLGTRVVLLSFWLFALSCVTYSYVPMAGSATTPKEPNCRVEVFTKPPEKPYQPLGLLNNDALSLAAVSGQEFLASVRESVCQAGGDAVIATVGPTGKFTRGTVIRFIEAPDAGSGAR
jgi:hypothetical protein